MRTDRTHDRQSQILKEETKLYDIGVIRNLVHLCISLSFQIVSSSRYHVGPSIFRQCSGCNGGMVNAP